MKLNGLRTVFRYRLRRLRGQILGWGIALALLGLLLVQFYDTIAAQQDQLNELIQNYPKEFIAFFGDIDDFSTPSGFLGIEFFSYMPLIVGVFSILIGSGLLVSDEESGRLDLIMAHPVSRAALYWGRWSAFTLATLAIMLITWFGLAAPAALGAMDVGWAEMALPFISLFASLAFFGTLSVLLSMLLPSRRTAAMVGGLILVAGYFLTALARINTDLGPVATLSPLYYYQGGEAMNGLNATWIIGLLGAAAVFSVMGWWRFERRDIRVGGEGAWQRPTIFSRVRPRRSRVGRGASVPGSAVAGQ